MTSQPLESKYTKLKSVSQEELIVTLASVNQTMANECVFDSKEMQIYVVLSCLSSCSIYDNLYSTYDDRLIIYTGRLYQDQFGLQTGIDSRSTKRLELIQTLLEKSKHLHGVYLYLDIADALDIPDRVKSFTPSKKTKYYFYLDIYHPEYAAARGPLRRITFLNEIDQSNFITNKDFKRIFNSAHNTSRSDAIYSNSYSATPVLSKALANKPWYKHKKPSSTSDTDTDTKIIFILSDYILYEYNVLEGINLNFYECLLSVAYKVFLWKGDIKNMTSIRSKSLLFNESSIAQPKQAININLIREHLSLSMPMHDKKIVPITAKDRILAIKSLFGPTYQKIKHVNPDFFKAHPAWKLPKPTLIASKVNRLQFPFPLTTSYDISFKHLTVGFNNDAEIEQLLNYIGSDNLIEHVHFERIHLKYFDRVLKNCPKVKTVSLEIELHEDAIDSFESLTKESSTKIVKAAIISRTNDVFHISELSHLINLKQLTITAIIDFNQQWSLPPSLKYLEFRCCSPYETISESVCQTFTNNLQQTHPNLIIAFSRRISKDEFTIQRALTTPHKFPKLSSDDLNNDLNFESKSTYATTPPKSMPTSTAYDPDNCYSAETSPDTAVTLTLQTRFYTADGDKILPPAHMDQDTIMSLIIREDKKQIGFATAATDFLPEKDQKQFYRASYEECTSAEGYLALQKELNLPKAVCGRVDAVILKGKSIYILPTPHADSSQSWELAAIAFEPPSCRDTLEIGRCPDLENVYALRLKDSQSTAQTFTARMILYPSNKTQSPKFLPAISPVKSAIYPILQWLAHKPKIKKCFPQFSQLISSLNTLQQMKIRLQRQDQQLKDKTNLMVFLATIRNQFELLQEYCEIGKGFKVGVLKIDWHSLLEPTDLKLLEQWDGLKDLLNNVLLQQGECQRATESFVFIATCYGLPTWMISSQIHDYVKTLCLIGKTQLQLNWITRDLGGAPAEFKQLPFFPEKLEQKLKPTAGELKQPQQAYSAREEFKPYQCQSSRCRSVTEFVTAVFAQTAPLVTYPADDPFVLEGFLTALCEHFRSLHPPDIKTRSTSQSATKILYALTDHIPPSSSVQDPLLSCWVKLVEHPDDLDALWQTHTIRDNCPLLVKSPLQNQLPTLVILDISAFSTLQLEAQINLLQPSPSLLYQSNLLPLPANCRIVYLCNEQKLATYSDVIKDLQEIPWVEALNSDFLNIRQSLPLGQQLQDNLSNPHPAELKPSTDALIYDLTTAEPTHFLAEDLQINDSKITLLKNPAVNALRTHKPIVIHHTFDSKNAAIFRHTALRTLTWEQHVSQEGQWLSLPANPLISLVKQPIIWPERLVEIQDKAQWLAWRSHQTVTTYLLNNHTYPDFIRNWQADSKTGVIITTQLPGILDYCKTTKALIEITDLIPTADWPALYSRIQQLPEGIQVAIYFHPRYREAPGLAQACKAPEIKTQSDAHLLQPKVFFADDNDLFAALHYLKTGKQLPEDIQPIPINAESTHEEIFEAFNPDFNQSFTDKNGSWRIQYEKSEVMSLLEQGKSVLLMGEISSELYASAESCLLNGYLWSNAQRLTFAGQLFLLSPPNPHLAQHLASFFNTQAIAVNLIHYSQWLAEIPTLAEQDKQNLQQAYMQTCLQLRWSWPRLQEVAAFLQQQPTERSAHFEHSPMQTKLLEDYDPTSKNYAELRTILLTTLCEEKREARKEKSVIVPEQLQPDSSPSTIDKTMGLILPEDKKPSIPDKVQDALTLLQQYKTLALLGSSGTGKTFTASVLIPQALAKSGKKCRLYIGEGAIEPWRKTDTDNVIHILLIDEVNIFPPGFLQPLMQPDAKCFWRSQSCAFKNDHWLIGTGNPRSYNGRHPVPEGMPTLWFQPFTRDDIYDFQIAPFLENIMKITDAAVRKTLAQVYLDGYSYVRPQALVSPRNLKRILSHFHALHSQYVGKNTIPASTELLTSWMRNACYIEFKPLAPGHYSEQKKTTFNTELAAALQLKKPLNISIPAKMRSTLLQKGSIPVQPIVILAHYLQTALQIRRNTLKHQLEPAGYGILFQSADMKAMRACVKAILTEKKLSYAMLSVNPEDEAGFKKSVKQNLQKNIIILENPHLITPSLEKWLNPLLEGMDIDQETQTPFPTECYLIFLHHDHQFLSAAIKNRLQLIQLEPCTQKDWQLILQQYTQNATLIALTVSTFATLLHEQTRLDKPALSNPNDLIQLCDRLKKDKWFERTTTPHSQWFYLYETVMMTFCLRWSTLEQRHMHQKLAAVKLEWLKQFPTETKSIIKVLEKNRHDQVSINPQSQQPAPDRPTILVAEKNDYSLTR